MAISKNIFDVGAFNMAGRMSELSILAGAEPAEARRIDVYLIDPNPANREVRPDEVRRLKESIRADGLAQPPLVRPKPGEPGRYEAIAGHHRILALRELSEEDGGSKWRETMCMVQRDCDDDKAERLMWATNYFNAPLTPEERGRAAEVLCAAVERERAEHPEAFKGKKTADVVADALSARRGGKVSSRTVARDRARYRTAKQAEEGAAKPSKPADPADGVRRRRDSAFSRLGAALEDLEGMQKGGVRLDVTTLRYYQRRLGEMARMAEGARDGQD